MPESPCVVTPAPVNDADEIDEFVVGGAVQEHHSAGRGGLLRHYDHGGGSRSQNQRWFERYAHNDFDDSYVGGFFHRFSNIGSLVSSCPHTPGSGPAKRRRQPWSQPSGTISFSVSTNRRTSSRCCRGMRRLEANLGMPTVSKPRVNTMHRRTITLAASSRRRPHVSR